MGLPKISIITVTYNCVSVIEGTIKNVLSLSYPNIEYIIIDGASKDGTVDIIRKYADRLSCWVSEPDKGIYDAMNKGIEMATGDWINFMNAGDTFHSPDILERIFGTGPADADIVYGDTVMVLNIGSFVKPAKAGVSAKTYMPFGHQSAFVRTSWMKKLKFDRTYRICADRNFFYRAYHAGAKFRYIPVTVADYEAEGGLSSTHSIRLRYETGRIEGKTKNPGWQIGHGVYIVYFKTKQFLKRILPFSIVRKIRLRNAAHNFK
jgi:glycosyltransferase involved in cell wall biosynthesis